MPDAKAVFERLTSGPLKSLSPEDSAVFRDRLDVHWDDCLRPLRRLYGQRSEFSHLPQRMMRVAARAYAGRPRSLREADLRRLNEPQFFQSSTQLGYLCDVARFAGDLKGVSRRASYFEELGVSCVHLLPVLTPREGEDDGGRAVCDHRRVNPALGTMGDLAALARRLRRAGIALGTDVVVDRTAKEHGWAQKALGGDARYRDYYLTYPDRELPDQFERTVADVGPESSGNFCWVEALERWVWTSYQDYQWDLDYSNPDVFAAMLENLLFVANRGASLIRLEGIERTWKRLGTSCVGQPEAAALLEAWRALSRIAAPSLLLWVHDGSQRNAAQTYLGRGISSGKQAQLASHGTLMTMLWSSIAEQNVRLATQVLAKQKTIPEDTAWITYAREHTTIDWHIADRDADAVSLSAPAHRQFLAQFYSGVFPGSFARGRNVDADSNFGGWRTSGSLACLAGLSAALESGFDEAAEQAQARILMVYGVLFAIGGMPLIHMGDELGISSMELDGPMDWQFVKQTRNSPETVQGRLFHALVGLIQARRRAFMLHGAARSAVVATGNDRVLGVVRSSARGALFALANSSSEPQTISRFELARTGLPERYADWREDSSLPMTGDVTLAAYQCMWLAAPESDA